MHPNHCHFMFRRKQQLTGANCGPALGGNASQIGFYFKGGNCWKLKLVGGET